ncbi:hypothetical protein [Microbacterium sp. RURRCA19A]|uniref:hypothetical protein n=1 Tax=Microbacterium sp. RURRCA19A TaxID=1907391 RepID=UPI00095555C6|nr:hypothetical protein [Microbacterium sp. RURRCA19A]SIS19326.1 hypothetical protein SAMN05880568_3442 [Microbacterium sp. RURRCA19A]
MPGPYSWKNILRGAIEANRDGGQWWKATQYALAFQAQEDARRGYPRPTRKDGYYSESDAAGTRIGQFIGPNGDITSERPHVHIIHNEGEGKIIFVVTQRDGSHSNQQYLPITASGNEVNAMVDRLRHELR